MTKTLEQRVEELERLVAEIPRRGKYIEIYERDLQEAALQYARVILHGFTLDDEGRRLIFGGSDKAMYEEYYLGKMKSAALSILREMAIEEKP